ncbi:putative oxidoreductase YdhV [Pelotomaculum schinkii]|uniref:Putative oxidoreductase YdhV n=1 Tax=Pelotomaculum schinkii TaxID=78350 RepID=A0A4Y7RIN9_9FIRM|nr:aldehyde ferredoxin oxidoreductase C-terminal domain-containing protein [Pelotomaculum schinkii]TEB08572.1 putative oxidoreductase YdhV [Pelotomaculum schinkii]
MADKFIRVKMDSKTVVYEERKDLELYGGRGLIDKILTDEVDPTCDALGTGNKLIVCVGLLNGTAAPASGRISVGCKSPLTGGAKEANAGGTAGAAFARLALKCIIIENAPAGDAWYILKVNKDGAVLLPGDKYVGLGTYATAERLMQDYGNKVSVMAIGPAGERGYKMASVQVSDPSGHTARAAGRGGVGAVMGSKRIKAIVLDTEGAKLEAEYADKEKFMEANRKFVEGIKGHPISGGGYPAMGTAAGVMGVNALGALPTKNFSDGRWDQAENISGETLAKNCSERGGRTGHACQPGCIIHCSNVYHGPDGKYLTSGLEYETIGLVGSNCLISNLDTVAKIDRMCDDIGIDTMDTGAAIAVAMESGKIAWGDDEAAIKLVQEIADGTEFGNIIGNGALAVGKRLGVKRIPVSKGQSFAAYDPRSLKGTGVTYATAQQGADHTCGNSLGTVEQVNPYDKAGQVELSTMLQVAFCMNDCTGMCLFNTFCTTEEPYLLALVNMFAGKFGGEWTVDRLMGLGVEAIALEKKFNEAAGVPKVDVPEFIRTEVLPSSGAVFDITDEELSQAIPF